MRAFLLSLGFLFAAAGGGAAGAETLTAATGYRLTYDVYGANGREPVALIFMHGKNSRHDNRGMVRFADTIAREGFRVYLPRMPWSQEWDGTHQDATAALDALVALAARDGKKVAVGGQSMGAMFSLVYRPADPPAAVAGRVLTSPGQLLDLIPPTAPFWKPINASLEKARTLEAAGKGKEKTSFGSSNTLGAKSFEESYDTTPEVFLSFHDLARFPSVKAAIGATTLPVFWAVGSRDPIPNAKRPTFDKIPPHPKSAYFDFEGEDHNTAMFTAVDKMVPWLKTLAAR